MAIVATELLFYGPSNWPESDTQASGGAINTQSKMDLVENLSPASTVTCVSDGPDTRTITVTGRTSAGAIVADPIILNNTNTVPGGQTLAAILKVVASAADAARTVTVRRASAPTDVICTLGPNGLGGGITRVGRFFYESASAAAQTVRYEKQFGRNNNTSLTLTNSTITLTADPSLKYKIGLATTKNDSASLANRLTAPTVQGGTFSDDNVAIAIAGGTLEAGSAIGVWIEQTLGAGDAATRSSFTLRLQGTTVQ